MYTARKIYNFMSRFKELLIIISTILVTIPICMCFGSIDEVTNTSPTKTYIITFIIAGAIVYGLLRAAFSYWIRQLEYYAAKEESYMNEIKNDTKTEETYNSSNKDDINWSLFNGEEDNKNKIFKDMG